MADLEGRVFQFRWDVPHDSPVAVLAYAMLQELATWLHYRNLRLRVDERGDPALSALFHLIAIDERAHHTFYCRAVRSFPQLDGQATLEQLDRVLNNFAMPAVHLLAQSGRRVAQIKALAIFDELT
jgi:acyl-[acyl-carrier-protein] desaturase